MPGKKRAVVKVHKRDRKIVQRYPSLVEAAEAEGVTDATLRARIIHGRLRSDDCLATTNAARWRQNCGT